MKSKFKPEACAADDISRAQLCEPYLFPDGRIVATDGRMLVIVPGELEEGDTAGEVSGEALEAARKLTGKHGDMGMKANGALVLQDGRTFPRKDWGAVRPFPDPVQVMPKGEPVFSVRLNPAYIAAVVKALGVGKGESITLEFYPDGRLPQPVKVTTSDAGACGLIMPIVK
jgi:hypothetical protein